MGTGILLQVPTGDQAPRWEVYLQCTFRPSLLPLLELEHPLRPTLELEHPLRPTLELEHPLRPTMELAYLATLEAVPLLLPTW